MSVSMTHDLRGREKRWLLLYEKNGEMGHVVAQAPNLKDAMDGTGMNPALFFGAALVDHKDTTGALFPRMRELAAKVREDAR